MTLATAIAMELLLSTYGSLTLINLYYIVKNNNYNHSLSLLKYKSTLCKIAKIGQGFLSVRRRVRN